MIILDRFEGGCAVLETDSGMQNVPKHTVAANAREGDVLVARNGTYYVDAAATKERRAKLLSRTKALKKKS